MIKKATYLGIPIRRRKNRRWLVVSYWIVVLVFLASLHWNPAMQSLLLGRFPSHGWAGPVATILTSVLFGYLTTCLGGVFERGMLSEWDGPLDERDIRVRNAAHFEAYRIFRMIIFPFALILAVVFGTVWSHYQKLAAPLLLLLWCLVFSLPQSLILWFEPDMEEPQ
jgi:hypothetical protein